MGKKGKNYLILNSNQLFTSSYSLQVSKKYVSKETAAKIHEKAQPFIKWLKEAEEESESEDDDELELEFDSRAHISRIKETSTEPAKDSTPAKEDKSAEEEDEDDVDIDNI